MRVWAAGAAVDGEVPCFRVSSMMLLCIRSQSPGGSALLKLQPQPAVTVALLHSSAQAQKRLELSRIKKQAYIQLTWRIIGKACGTRCLSDNAIAAPLLC